MPDKPEMPGLGVKLTNLTSFPVLKMLKLAQVLFFADQVARYGDEETAAKICGWIKANYQEMAEEDGLENACWPGWTAIGTKELDGRTVPNCVPDK
jgi:hypothetical protein